MAKYKRRPKVKRYRRSFYSRGMRIRKIVSFLGTMIVSVGSQLTGSANVGVGSLIVLFIVGFVLFRVSCKKEVVPE